ncbi:MAG TPA: NAD(P)(+) transhydrogenase (Re/Si-specific) subunit beta [Thermoplasmata archaeon]|nr:NAD(P)(+) transhydrogenase (Re/Si-specific) subunit beta [Thermoplasmata archaeon]
MSGWQQPVVDGVYVLAVIVFILGLKAMSSPTTARRGIVFAGVAMLIAVAVTFVSPVLTGSGFTNFALIAIGVIAGSGAGYYWAKVVKMTAMPQMVAIFNGMGGGSAAAIAAVVLLSVLNTDRATSALSLAGAVIGSISIAGSVIAFLKLQGWMPSKAIVLPARQVTNIAVLVLGVGFGVYGFITSTELWFLPFYIFLLLYGILLTIPIGGADMPVVISLFNALTGIAVALDGFALVNGPLGDAGYAMVIAGMLVGSAGSLLTFLMAKAMNRSVSNVFFSAFGATEETGVKMAGALKPIEASDVAVMMEYANLVIIAPGYGMAVAQAQQKVKELSDLLEAKGVTVKFAIHPVAGRMPGHMNVLLAEANISYDKLFDRDEINNEFPNADVVLVIGANDVVNPAAHRQGSPLYGMPILDVEKAKNIIVIKRGQGKGFAGIENDLFYRDNCHMLYGDAQAAVGKLVSALKKSS